MKIEKLIGIGLFLVLVITSSFVKPLAKSTVVNNENDPPFLELPTNWADSIFNTTTMKKMKKFQDEIFEIRQKLNIKLREFEKFRKEIEND